MKLFLMSFLFSGACSHVSDMLILWPFVSFLFRTGTIKKYLMTSILMLNVTVYVAGGFLRALSDPGPLRVR